MSAGFCQQGTRDSCVAACCTMLLHRHQPAVGETISQTHDRLRTLLATPSVPGLLPTLSDGARLIGATAEWLDPVEDASFDVLEGLAGVTWCALVVMGGIWTHAVHRPGSKLKEPHGRLSSERLSALPMHAVVVTAWDRPRISVHDPWFDVLDQPLRLDPAYLRKAWTGELVYFPPFARGDPVSS